MKYVTEMGSGAMIYMPRLIKIGSGVQKLIRTRREEGVLVNLSYFFRIRKVNLSGS